MDSDAVKIAISAALGGIVGYFLKWLEFRRQHNKEERLELRNSLKELHVGVLEAMNRFVAFALDVNQFVHGEMPGEGAITAIGRLGRPCREIMVKTTSLQRLCAKEYMDTWEAVIREMEGFFLITGEVMTGSTNMSKLESSVNNVRRSCAAFLLCVEEKIAKL
ncbi:MAG: hypothetical protein ACKVRN_15235 [Pyrinomonadaceae bacterium]